MTLESRNNVNLYVGNGVSVDFPFNFRAWKPEYVQVLVGDGVTESDVSASCAISVTETGGNVRFVAPPASGVKIAVRRNMPFAQYDDYRNGTRFDAEVVEDRFDKDCAERQDLLSDIDRAVKMPVTSGTTPEAWLENFSGMAQSVQDTAVQVRQWLDDMGTEAAGASTPVTAAGSTASRTLGQRFADIVNVKDYGAKGDGETDDTAAFKAAVEAAGQAAVFVPRGTYVLAELVGGRFVSDGGAAFTGAGGILALDEVGNSLPAPKDLVSHGLNVGKIPGTYEPVDGEYIMLPAIFQSAAYDKYDNILYVTNNYNEGALVYAIRWSDNPEDRELLGTNFSPYASGGSDTQTPFYNSFGHQNASLYRPAKTDPVRFLTAASEYTAAGTTDSSLPYCGRLVRWDYRNPTSVTVEKTWKLFDASVYTVDYNQFCASSDGKYAIARATVTATGVRVFGIWKMEDLLALSGTDATGIATYVPLSTGTQDIGSQALVSDGKYIYNLYSPTGRTPHELRIFDFDGNLVYERMPSIEGYNAKSFASGAYSVLYNLEAETLSFMPIHGRYALVMGVGFTTKNADESEQHKGFYFFDLTTKDPDENNEIQAINKYFTSSDLTSSLDIDPHVKGTAFYNSGSVADLSGGQWLFHTLGSVRAGYYNRQIGFQINTLRNMLLREYNETSKEWTDYLVFAFYEPNTVGTTNSHVFTVHCDYMGDEVDYFDASNSNTRTAFKLLSNRDTDGKSCGYVSRMRRNYDQGESGGYSTFNIEVLENEVRTPLAVFLASYASGGTVSSFDFFPHPETKSVSKLGTATNTWANEYFATSPSVSSDERVKNNIASPTEALMRAWGKVGFKVFQFREAIERKGADEARLHVGVIAQQVAAAFESEGLDAGRYGLFCHDEWSGEGGTQEAGDRYGIRYEEALALECAYQRWRLEQLEERVNQLINNTNN